MGYTSQVLMREKTQNQIHPTPKSSMGGVLAHEYYSRSACHRFPMSRSRASPPQCQIVFPGYSPSSVPPQRT